MEVRRNDAKVARDRCLEAMIDCADEETRRSLWKAAIRYHGRLRDEARQAIEAAAPLTAQAASGRGSLLGRAVEDLTGRPLR